ncbi:MAG: ABC transporter substrate-binding protein [Candidatus Thermoplasmatota archaeon]|jgi:iron complex transport system substrate-binding protein|nr:ABC transporter substrate-binding protein [Candidatus Thermoplasmatota archaeon]MCL5785677.1 ABC transporter substrate-binding protein [Candidatus Thermoplasmatota archaeon]
MNKRSLGVLRDARVLVAVVIALIVVIGGLSFYYYEQKPQVQKGQVLTMANGNDSSYRFTRIVSLDPAATATLYALGSYKYLVAGTSYDNYPPGQSLPNITDYPSLDVEQIINLTPQVVISFDNYSGTQAVNQILGAGIDYVYLDAGGGSSFQLIEQQNAFLGEITGNAVNASKLNSWMNQSLLALKNSSSSINDTGLNAFYYMDSGGGIWTAGYDTFVNQYFQYAGLKNIAAPYGSNFYTISPEDIANNSPQVIFLDQYVPLNATDVSPFNSTPAVKNSKVFTIPSEDIFTEPNFRDIYAIQWMIYVSYNVSVRLPAFPLSLGSNPDPVITG